MNVTAKGYRSHKLFKNMLSVVESMYTYTMRCIAHIKMQILLLHALAVERRHFYPKHDLHM